MSRSSRETTGEVSVVYAGKYLSMHKRGGWEYATRNIARSAVGIVAITDAGNVVLVEQHRPPVGQSVIELPAGLCGDIVGKKDEAPLEAAKRELLEETGYAAGRWTELLSGYSSPGLTDEEITLFLAEELTKVGQGGGEKYEQITVHEVPVADVAHWLAERRAKVDLKLLAGLFAADEHQRSQRGTQ